MSIPNFFDGVDKSIPEIFETLDKNKDGKISWDEFAHAIRVFTPSTASEEIDRMFRELDVDGDGQIDVGEFASCFLFDDKVALKEAFDLYDIDGDGKISANELHIVLKRLGEKHSMEECTAIIRAVDADGDGYVNFEEFKIMMN